MTRSSSSGSSRRTFLKLAGAVGLSAAIASPVAVLAQAAARSAAKPPPGKPVPAKPDTSGAKAEPPSEFVDDAKTMALVVKRRYGSHLDAKQLEAVTQDLDDGMQIGKLLRAVRLANGDEPEVTFHA